MKPELAQKIDATLAEVLETGGTSSQGFDVLRWAQQGLLQRNQEVAVDDTQVVYEESL